MMERIRAWGRHIAWCVRCGGFREHDIRDRCARCARRAAGPDRSGG